MNEGSENTEETMQDKVESEARRELKYEKQRARNTGPHEYSCTRYARG